MSVYFTRGASCQADPSIQTEESLFQKIGDGKIGFIKENIAEKLCSSKLANKQAITTTTKKMK